MLIYKSFREISFPSVVTYAGGAIGTTEGKEISRKDL